MYTAIRFDKRYLLRNYFSLEKNKYIFKGGQTKSYFLSETNLLSFYKLLKTKSRKETLYLFTFC